VRLSVSLRKENEERFETTGAKVQSVWFYLSTICSSTLTKSMDRIKRRRFSYDPLDLVDAPKQQIDSIVFRGEWMIDPGTMWLVTNLKRSRFALASLGSFTLNSKIRAGNQ
jgi:hypothetical protein